MFVDGVYSVNADDTTGKTYKIYTSNTDQIFAGVNTFLNSKYAVKQADGTWKLAGKITLKGGYVELLGIPCTINNTYKAGKGVTVVKGGKAYWVHMTRSDDGKIDDSDTSNGLIDDATTTAADSAYYGQTGCPWTSVSELCQWTIINGDGITVSES